MPPIILCISGHDPSGGAGIQADIETIKQLGGHAASLISCLTRQDSRGLQAYQPVDAGWLQQQAALVIADYSIAAVKIGALGSADIAQACGQIIQQLREKQASLPVIIDPVLGASSGGTLSDSATDDTIVQTLLPLCSVLTPNQSELERLSGISDNPSAAAQSLMQQGCKAVLLTGSDSHPKTGHIKHQLYSQGNIAQTLSCERLAGHYHGSGCTLASALAFYLAQGLDILEATTAAQHYCWQSLALGQALGSGQLIPWRGPLNS